MRHMQVKAAISCLVYVKGKCNITSCQKSHHWGRRKHVTWCEARRGHEHCPVAHLDVHGWSDGLTAVISCFLVCGSHNSARHRHLHPSHAIGGTSTICIHIAMKVAKSVPSEAWNWWTETDPNIPPSVQIHGPSRKMDSQIGSLLSRIKTDTVKVFNQKTDKIFRVTPGTSLLLLKVT